MNNREKEVEAYIECISFSKDISFEFIRNEIEKIIDTNIGEEVVVKIIKGVTSNLDIIKELNFEATSIEDKKELEEDITRISKMLQELSLCIEKYKKRQQQEEKYQEIGVENILFATNEYGNYMIKKDLKEIKNNASNEQYDDFRKLFKMLKDGYTGFNEEKQRPIVGNDKVKGLYELKEYQARIVYRYVKDCIVVVGATIKKEDNSKKYRQFLINCKEKSQEYIDQIKNETVDFNNLIEESSEFYESLIGEVLK